MYCKRWVVYFEDGTSKIVWGKTKRDVYEQFEHGKYIKPFKIRSVFQMGQK